MIKIRLMKEGFSGEPKQRLSKTVIEAVAASEDVAPLELSEPLFTSINPEALDALFNNSVGQLTFEYHGYKVIISSNGDVDVDPLYTG